MIYVPLPPALEIVYVPDLLIAPKPFHNQDLAPAHFFHQLIQSYIQFLIQ